MAFFFFPPGFSEEKPCRRGFRPPAGPPTPPTNGCLLEVQVFPCGCSNRDRWQEGPGVELPRFRFCILLRPPPAEEFVLAVMSLSEETLRELSIARLRELLKGWPSIELPRGGFNAPALPFSNCIGAVLNQIAAGASLVTGYGTPLCGPYYYYCCVGAVAWYASAFMETWNACS